VVWSCTIHRCRACITEPWYCGMCTDDSACVALTDMPPRSEHELDPVTLHNQGLMNMEQNATEGFEKLQFLIQQNPFPPETFPNLLLLYVKYEVGEVLIFKKTHWISFAHSRLDLFLWILYVGLSKLAGYPSTSESILCILTAKCQLEWCEHRVENIVYILKHLFSSSAFSTVVVASGLGIIWSVKAQFQQSLKILLSSP